MNFSFKHSVPSCPLQLYESYSRKSFAHSSLSSMRIHTYNYILCGMMMSQHVRYASVSLLSCAILSAVLHRIYTYALQTRPNTTIQPRINPVQALIRSCVIVCTCGVSVHHATSTMYYIVGISETGPSVSNRSDHMLVGPAGQTSEYTTSPSFTTLSFSLASGRFGSLHL